MLKSTSLVKKLVDLFYTGTDWINNHIVYKRTFILKI